MCLWQQAETDYPVVCDGQHSYFLLSNAQVCDIGNCRYTNDWHVRIEHSPKSRLPILSIPSSFRSIVLWRPHFEAQSLVPHREYGGARFNMNVIISDIWQLPTWKAPRHRQLSGENGFSLQTCLILNIEDAIKCFILHFLVSFLLFFMFFYLGVKVELNPAWDKNATQVNLVLYDMNEWATQQYQIFQLILPMNDQRCSTLVFFFFFFFCIWVLVVI